MGQTGGSDGWSRLDCCVEKGDIIKHYDGNPLMPMQLRMFVEEVYGTGPGGQSGKLMLATQMMAESGEINQSILSLR